MQETGKREDLAMLDLCTIEIVQYMCHKLGSAISTFIMHIKTFIHLKKQGFSLAVVYFWGTSEDDIYVQAVTGLILDMLDRVVSVNEPWMTTHISQLLRDRFQICCFGAPITAPSRSY